MLREWEDDLNTRGRPTRRAYTRADDDEDEDEVQRPAGAASSWLTMRDYEPLHQPGPASLRSVPTGGLGAKSRRAACLRASTHFVASDSHGGGGRRPETGDAAGERRVLPAASSAEDRTFRTAWQLDRGAVSDRMCRGDELEHQMHATRLFNEQRREAYNRENGIEDKKQRDSDSDDDHDPKDPLVVRWERQREAAEAEFKRRHGSEIDARGLET